MKSTTFLLISTILFLLNGCSQKNIQPIEEPAKPRTLIPAESKIVDSDNRFGIKLFKELNKEDKNKSIFISPLSISMALSMALNGSSGTTYDAMRNALEIAGLTEKELNESTKSLIELLTHLDKKVKFDIANSIWFKKSLPVEKEFIDLNKSYFNAEVKSLNFSDPAAAD